MALQSSFHSRPMERQERWIGPSLQLTMVVTKQS